MGCVASMSVAHALYHPGGMLSSVLSYVCIIVILLYEYTYSSVLAGGAGVGCPRLYSVWWCTTDAHALRHSLCTDHSLLFSILSSDSLSY